MRPENQRVRSVACLAGILGLLAGYGVAPAAAETAPTAPGPSSIDAHVEVVGGIVSVRARDVIAQAVLAEIAEHNRLKLGLHEPTGDLITVKIDRLPLPEGLRRIFPGRSFSLRAADSTSTAHPAGEDPDRKVRAGSSSPACRCSRCRRRCTTGP